VVGRPQRRVAEFVGELADDDHRVAVPEAAVVRQVQSEDHLILLLRVRPLLPVRVRSLYRRQARRGSLASCGCV
jgi:hypothetical protein